MACVYRKLQLSPFEQNPLVFRWKHSSLPLGVGVLSPSSCYEPLRKLLLGNSQFGSEILFGQGITDAFPSGDNSELPCLVINKGRFPPSRLFVLLLPKNKIKVLTAMVLRSHFPQFPLFSECPIMSPNSLNHCVIHQDLVEHVDNQKRFKEYLIYSRVFRGIPTSRRGSLQTRGNKSLMNVGRHNCSVSQDRGRIDWLYVIPHHPA